MKLLKIPPAVRLVEFAHVAPDTISGRQIVPMQLFQYQGRMTGSLNRIFVISGFQGPSKNDVHVSGLLQKALSKHVFSPVADVFVTPVVNPSSDPKEAWFNHKGIDLRVPQNHEDPSQPPVEIQTIQRWIEFAKPKAIIHLTTGTAGVHAFGVPQSVSQRLADLTEKPLQEVIGSEENTPPFGLREWSLNHEMIWIEFSLDETKKSFDDVRDGEWKKAVGPALKWLLEGERFNPPKEENLSLDHLIVPALEMPPEFAHL